jgi:AraC family transcriptional regulator, regulatory protein of adaptative response / methylated-DNA-[protein]-cysteine methyltransferase
MLNEDRCWTAVVKKDRKQDGQFFFGVITTRVFCRPSCPARMPLRKNVRFYETSEQALRDGLRACLRCRPLDRADERAHASKIRALCRYIRDHADQSLTLDVLAARAQLSRFHLQRTFKAIVGVTPKDYVEGCRVGKLKSRLRLKRSVTDAVYESGFGSSSRVYERADTRLGMTPSAYRSGGSGATISYAARDTPLGWLMIGATRRGLCFVQFGESSLQLLAALRQEYPNADIEQMGEQYRAEFERWMKALTAHIEGFAEAGDLPLDVRGTAFQLKVWRYLQAIPPGDVQSYGEVARGIGRPSAVRAVARACAANRVAITIPCHRVVRGDGGLGGYKWGVARKRALLDRERTMRSAGMARA